MTTESHPATDTSPDHPNDLRIFHVDPEFYIKAYSQSGCFDLCQERKFAEMLVRRIQADAERMIGVINTHNMLNRMLTRREQVAMAIGNAFIAAGHEGVPEEEWFRRADRFLQASKETEA